MASARASPTSLNPPALDSRAKPAYGGFVMRLPSSADCRRNAARFDRLLPHVFTYADRKRITDGAVGEYFALSDLWEQNVLGMLVAGAVCCAPATCTAFVWSARDALAPDEAAWEENEDRGETDEEIAAAVDGRIPATAAGYVKPAVGSGT
jgi:hypothetical protein